MKKNFAVISAVMIGAFAFIVGGCSKDKASQGKSDANNKLVVWSFTDELNGMIDNYFKKDSRFAGKYDISFSLTPTDQFPNKLDPVLASGSGCPDVFALEDAFVRKYI